MIPLASYVTLTSNLSRTHLIQWKPNQNNNGGRGSVSESSASPHTVINSALSKGWLLSDLQLDWICDRIWSGSVQMLGYNYQTCLTLLGKLCRVNWNWTPRTLPDKFGLTTGPDQAFDPIVRVGKSAVNQPDNPLASHQPHSVSLIPFQTLLLIPCCTYFRVTTTLLLFCCRTADVILRDNARHAWERNNHFSGYINIDFILDVMHLWNGVGF